MEGATIAENAKRHFGFQFNFILLEQFLLDLCLHISNFHIFTKQQRNGFTILVELGEVGWLDLDEDEGGQVLILLPQAFIVFFPPFQGIFGLVTRLGG